MYRSKGMNNLTRLLSILVVTFFVANCAYASESNHVDPTKSLIKAFTSSSFSPSQGQVFDIPLDVKLGPDLDKVVVELYTEDKDLVRQFIVRKFSKKEAVKVQWDGRDSDGIIVPDEVYFPKITAHFRNGKVRTENTLDALWGEEVYDFEKTTRNGVIEYRLPEHSRLLIRAGIKNGPMLRTVVDWEPRTKGFHAERWNGKDSNNLKKIEGLPGIAYLIIGYRLPEKTIQTYGNTKLGYKDYRKSKEWSQVKLEYGKKLLERAGKPMRSEFYLPLEQLKSPALKVESRPLNGKVAVKSFHRFEEIVTSVNIAKEDEFYLDQSRYEISFFVDYQFIAEEEQGYVPFRWRWSPGRYGIEPGEHVLTVNISSYNGQVTVKNMNFELKKEEPN